MHTGDVLWIGNARRARSFSAIDIGTGAFSLALVIGCIFFRAWCRSHFFPRWQRLYFPTLCSGCERLHAFSCLASVAYLLALGSGYMFTAHVWHRLHVFPALGTGCIFLFVLGRGRMLSCALHASCFPQGLYLFLVTNSDGMVFWCLKAGFHYRIISTSTR